MMPILILGAGPAGVATAHRLARRRRFDVTLLEAECAVGGTAGSFDLEGLRVDYGSHRLHPTCLPAILDDIRDMLGPDLLERPRQGRIRLRGRWLRFPLKPLDLFSRLPPSFMLGVMRDIAVKPFHNGSGDTFAAALEKGLGRTICRDFYFPYAEKIWGVPPGDLDAEQARRRVAAGTLTKLVCKVARAFPGLARTKGARFYYPKLGFGQISEAFSQAAVAEGARVRLKTTVAAVEVEQGRAVAVSAEGEAGGARLEARHVFSTIPLPQLVRSVRPAAPPQVLDAAEKLKHRAMVLLYLVLDADQFTPYDAHYFPDAGVTMTRLSEPKNYGLALLPGTTVLCAELPCSPDDAIWSLSDEQLSSLVQEDLGREGLSVSVPVRRVATRRLRQAYPIYTRDYREHFERLDAWISTIDGLTTLGRQGLFVHDNTHHALAMGYAAGDCLAADGDFDRPRWLGHRRQFEAHVVED